MFLIVLLAKIAAARLLFIYYTIFKEVVHFKLIDVIASLGDLEWMLFLDLKNLHIFGPTLEKQYAPSLFC